MAQQKGLEPSVLFGTPVFETGALNQTLPLLQLYFVLYALFIVFSSKEKVCDILITTYL